jgi:hypothetical protein
MDDMAMVFVSSGSAFRIITYNLRG